MSPERKEALDVLRYEQKVLAYWRERYGNDRDEYLRSQKRYVLEALDRYWGVISREELLDHSSRPYMTLMCLANSHRNDK